MEAKTMDYSRRGRKDDYGGITQKLSVMIEKLDELIAKNAELSGKIEKMERKGCSTKK
jgi:hypothetical protein